eukprot:4182921-Alexandrium_andersonii.AAC.1
MQQIWGRGHRGQSIHRIRLQGGHSTGLVTQRVGTDSFLHRQSCPPLSVCPALQSAQIVRPSCQGSPAQASRRPTSTSSALGLIGGPLRSPASLFAMWSS